MIEKWLRRLGYVKADSVMQGTVEWSRNNPVRVDLTLPGGARVAGELASPTMMAGDLWVQGPFLGKPVPVPAMFREPEPIKPPVGKTSGDPTRLPGEPTRSVVAYGDSAFAGFRDLPEDAQAKVCGYASTGAYRAAQEALKLQLEHASKLADPANPTTKENDRT